MWATTDVRSAKGNKERHSWSIDGTLVVKRRCRRRRHGPDADGVPGTRSDLSAGSAFAWVVGRRPADDAPSSPFVPMCSCATVWQVIRAVRNTHLLPRPCTQRGMGAGATVPPHGGADKVGAGPARNEAHRSDAAHEEKEGEGGDDVGTDAPSKGDGARQAENSASVLPVSAAAAVVDDDVIDAWLYSRVNSLVPGGRVEFSLDDRTAFCVECVPAFRSDAEPPGGRVVRTRSKKWADAAYAAYTIIFCLLGLAYLMRLLRK